jgi:hypothetical protein
MTLRCFVVTLSASALTMSVNISSESLNYINVCCYIRVSFGNLESFYPLYACVLNPVISVCMMAFFKTFSHNSLCYYTACRLQWPHGLRHELSSFARTLGLWVRITIKSWMFVCVYSVFVLSCVGSGLETG